VSLAANHFILLIRITIPIQIVFNGIYYSAGITFQVTDKPTKAKT